MKFLKWLSERLLVLSILITIKIEEKIFTPLAWFVRQVLLPLLRVVGRLAVTATFVLTMMYFVFKAPALHELYIRTYVGDHVYYVSPGQGGGTAFLITAPSGKTYFMTNDHICVGSENGMMIVTPERGFGRVYKIIARSEKTDLCLIEAPAGATGLYIAGTTYAGDRVQAVGHPDLMPLTTSNIGQIIHVGPATLQDKASAEPTPLASIANCDTKNPKYQLIKPKKGEAYCQINVPNAFYTNVLIQPGNSGSPLVDFWGDVVGVVSGVDPYGWGLAVTMSDVQEFLLDK